MVAIHGIPCCGACQKAYGMDGEVVEMTNYKTEAEMNSVPNDYHIKVRDDQIELLQEENFRLNKRLDEAHKKNSTDIFYVLCLSLITNFLFLVWK